MVQPKYRIYAINRSNTASSEYHGQYEPTFRNRYVLDEPDNRYMNGEFDSAESAIDAIKEYNTISKEMFGETFTILPVYTIYDGGSINGRGI